MIHATVPIPPLPGVLLCMGVFLCGLSVYTYRRQSTPGSAWFARLLATFGAGICVAVGSGFAIGFDGNAWLSVLYAAVLITPVPWIGFVAAFTGRAGLLDRRRLSIVAFPLVAGVAIVLSPAVTGTAGPAFLFGVIAVFFYAVMLAFVGGALLIRTTYLYAHLSLPQGVAPAIAVVEPWFVLTIVFQPVEASPWFRTAIVAAGMGLVTALFAASVLRLGLLDTAAAPGNIGRETVVGEINELVVVVDEERRVVVLNDAARSELDPAEPGGLGAPIDAVLGHEFETLRASRTVELFTGDGYRTFEASVSPIEDQHGRSFGAVVTLSDVTEREIRQNQLRVLNRVLRHNLRNRMDVVHALAGEVDDGGTGDRIKETADALLEVSDRARETERMTRTASITTSAVDLATLVSSVVEDVRERYPDADIDASVPPDRTVRTDRAILESVLSNLVENAAGHNDADDSRVSVSATFDPPDRAGMVEIRIADNGPGIPDHELAVIESGEERDLHHGSGLGLWAARWGTRILGGDLRFEDNHPRGTVAFVYLPAGGDG